MDYHVLSDNELVDLCMEGDHRAYDTLVRKYQQVLYVTACQITGDQVAAKDVVQNVFIKAWQKLATFDKRFRYFSWLYRITVNESLNHKRDNHAGEELPVDLSHESDPHQDMEATESNLRLQEAIEQLPLEHRMVLYLKYFDDLPYRDIAYILEIDENLVKSRLYTARIRLRELLVN
jgi:RNA polymerase sigma-70 factor (ECF subfamily)